MRQPDLPFDLEGPACNTFITIQEEALLCDAYGTCHRSVLNRRQVIAKGYLE